MRAPLLLLGVLFLPAMAYAEDPSLQTDTSYLKVALALGGTVGALRHPATTLPATTLGLKRTTPDQDAAARVTFGVQLALSQFFNVDSLWESNALDWYFAKNLRVFSLRLGLDKELALSRRFALGLGLHGALAEASIGTGETASHVPQAPDEGLGPASTTELRANQWLVGMGATASLLVLTHGPLFLRLQTGYSWYPQKAQHFMARGRDYTPEGFSVSLSGPFAGASIGVRL